MNKKLIYLFMFVFLATFATAAWLFVIQANVSTNVISIPGYASLAIEVPQLSVNTTDGADSNTVSSTFIVNKDITLNVSLLETYQDDSAGQCSGGIDDCTITYLIQNTSSQHTNLVDGQTVFLEAIRGERTLNVTMSCEAYSCPQSRDIDVVLTEVLDR